MIKLILDITRRFKKDDVPALGSQLAFNLILSFFPFIIFIMTLIGHTSLNSMEVLGELSKILPKTVYDLVKNTVLEVINTRRSRLMSLSLLFTLFSSSAGFNAVIKGLNKAYNIEEHRSFIRIRIISLLGTIGMAFVIEIMFVLLVFGRVLWTAISYKLGLSRELITTWLTIRYIIVISTTIFVFSALYRYAPGRKLTWQEVLPGALFSTFSLITVSIIFAFYVNNFGNYSIIYGSIGTIIVLLLWLFFISIIVILGGEVNASLVYDNNIIVLEQGVSGITRKK